MGKIRVRTLGEEETEKKQKQEARLASEAKRTKKKVEQKKLVKGAKGGERIVAVGPSEEELARLQSPEGEASGGQAKPEETTTETQKKKSREVLRSKGSSSAMTRSDSARKKQGRSPKYLAIAKLIDKTKTYSLNEALKLLEKTHFAGFDETVELHINTTETGISGTTTLPHGSGKEIRVVIANDQIIDNVQKGKIDFDVLLAAPSMMPKLAKVAKFLGPRGLMPNPKNGTMTNDPEKTAKSFQKGQINFKTEAKAPIIHLRVGKLSFGEEKLEKNIKIIIEAIKKERIRQVVLKSTMSPGIKLQII